MLRLAFHAKLSYLDHPMNRLLILCFSVILLASCQKSPVLDEPASYPVSIRFSAESGASPLVYDQQYTNEHGESFSVSAFKYYIVDLTFRNNRDGRERKLRLSDDHFLVDHGQGISPILEGSLPEGSYDRISFTLGVDSSRNYSGAQTGALDPLHGMFWTWSTGYIMAKLEGISPAAATINNAFEYHIGGFSGANNVTRRISLMLPQPLENTASGAGYLPELVADVQQWFSGKHSIRIADFPVVIMPGEMAVRFADNYSGMFNVKAGN